LYCGAIRLSTRIRSFSIAALSPLLTLSFVTLVHQRQALPARHRSTIIRGDPFHFGPMSPFFVARITQNHAIIVEGVQVGFLFSDSGRWPLFVSILPN
jgi:hypothetical protein